MTAVRIATRGLAVLVLAVGVALVHANTASAATVVLTPPADVNQVGTQHTVMAQASGCPLNPTCAFVQINFQVLGGGTPNPNGGVRTTDFFGQTTFTFTNTTAGVINTIQATVRVSGDGQGMATKTWIAGPPRSVFLFPNSDTNPVGTLHTVTATVRDQFNNPTPGQTVQFTVTGGGTAPAGGGSVTNAAGQATFTFTNTTAGVTNSIRAFVPACPCFSNLVTKTWVAGPPRTLTLSPPADSNAVGTQHCVTATVRDQFGNPTPNIRVRFTVTGSVNTAGVMTTNASGMATFCYTGPTAPGADAIHAYADFDNDNFQDPNQNEPFGDATKTWVAGPLATLTLDPIAETNPVDTEHCVTATVRDAFGNPVPGVTVRFSVTGSVSASGSATTNASGEAVFCYDGPPFPGADMIHAYADLDNDSTEDPGEPSGNATKTWVLPVSTPGCEVKITNGGWIIALNDDRASFGGNAKVDADGNVTGNEEYQDHGPADPMNLHGNVLVVICTSATEATIYGEATIDGAGSFIYRIKVRDLAEPGKGMDTYEMFVDNGYYSGDQTLQGGNVQIHKS
jgi:Big-like domain-containing protein